MLFSGNLTPPQAPPHNANNVNVFTFVMLCSGNLIHLNSPLSYVILEWPQSANFSFINAMKIMAFMHARTRTDADLYEKVQKDMVCIVGVKMS